MKRVYGLVAISIFFVSCSPAQAPAPAAGASATKPYGSLAQVMRGIPFPNSNIPGRKCDNGRDVPVNQDDFKKWAQGLQEAGAAAYKAAQSKNMDQMVEVSGTVADACAACHEKYRDKEDLKMRCIP
jgi:cytochrome c556